MGTQLFVASQTGIAPTAAPTAVDQNWIASFETAYARSDFRNPPRYFMPKNVGEVKRQPELTFHNVQVTMTDSRPSYPDENSFGVVDLWFSNFLYDQRLTVFVKSSRTHILSGVFQRLAQLPC